MSLLVHRLAALLAIGLFLASAAFAQIRSATISGHVSDPSGAPVPGADITVNNTGTNTSYTTKSTDAGDFTVPYLAAGTYAIEVAHAGFTPYRQTGVTVSVSQVVSIPVDLVIGGVASTVQVSAQGEQLQTASSDVSSAVAAPVIDVIPNITQNPLYYSLLQNGVQPRNENFSSTNTNSFGIGVSGRAQFSAIGVNGGRAFTNDIQLDGLPIMGGGFNEAAIIPNTEGLQEVRVISSNFTAEYGHGQSVIEMTTKSGTNQFHGEGNYLLRNDALNANTFGNNVLNLSRPPLKIHQFGGALSGPIIRNKLFFSSSYHYLTYNQGANNLLTVPTALERVGNFSQTLIKSSNGTPVPAQLFNPFSVTQIANDLYQRAPFPNAVIPNPNPIGEYILSFFPLPNHTPTDPYNTNNYQSSTINTTRWHTLNNRVDLKQGANSIYASGGFDFGTILTSRPFGTKGFNDAPQVVSDRNPYGQIGDTISLSPTLLLDIRYGVTRIVALQLGGNRTGFTTAQYNAFGVPASTQAIMPIPGVAPVIWPIDCCSGDQTGSGGGSNWSNLSDGQFTNKQEHQLSHALAASVVKVHGKWTHKAGIDMRVLLSNYQDMEDGSTAIEECCNNIGGNYSFQYVTANGGFASQNSSLAQAGIGGAALLLGESIWWVRPGTGVTLAFAQKYFAVYSQNDWHVTPQLTLNLGLRWDIQPGPTERYNRISAYDFTQQNRFGTPGSFYFAGADGNSRNLWPTEYRDFGPRIGAAYQIGKGWWCAAVSELPICRAIRVFLQSDLVRRELFQRRHANESLRHKPEWGSGNGVYRPRSHYSGDRLQSFVTRALRPVQYILQSEPDAERRRQAS